MNPAARRRLPPNDVQQAAPLLNDRGDGLRITVDLVVDPSHPQAAQRHARTTRPIARNSTMRSSHRPVPPRTAPITAHVAREKMCQRDHNDVVLMHAASGLLEQ